MPATGSDPSPTGALPRRRPSAGGWRRGDRVYRNTVEDLLEIVRETPAEVTTLAIVGHNPGIQDLAIALDDGRGDDAGRRELTTKYRTSGVAVFDVSDSWAGVRSGTLTSFAAPR